MPLGTLQHFTIEPSDLERTKEFYCDALGLEVGDRPPLDFPGYWLYSAGVATVHLMAPANRATASWCAAPRRNSRTPAVSTISPLPRPTPMACANGYNPET
jgi:catechol 2,3-dioxygenase-like lactoylglutathione lyase family enzyme